MGATGHVGLCSQSRRSLVCWQELLYQPVARRTLALPRVLDQQIRHTSNILLAMLPRVPWSPSSLPLSICLSLDPLLGGSSSDADWPLTSHFTFSTLLGICRPPQHPMGAKLQLHPCKGGSVRREDKETGSTLSSHPGPSNRMQCIRVLILGRKGRTGKESL